MNGEEYEEEDGGENCQKHLCPEAYGESHAQEVVFIVLARGKLLLTFSNYKF